MESRVFALYMISGNGSIRESRIFDADNAPRKESLSPLLLSIGNSFSSRPNRSAVLGVDIIEFSHFDLVSTVIADDTTAAVVVEKGFTTLADLLLKKLQSALSLLKVDDDALSEPIDRSLANIAAGMLEGWVKNLQTENDLPLLLQGVRKVEMSESAREAVHYIVAALDAVPNVRGSSLIFRNDLTLLDGTIDQKDLASLLSLAGNLKEMESTELMRSVDTILHGDRATVVFIPIRHFCIVTLTSVPMDATQLALSVDEAKHRLLSRSGEIPSDIRVPYAAVLPSFHPVVQYLTVNHTTGRIHSYSAKPSSSYHVVDISRIFWQYISRVITSVGYQAADDMAIAMDTVVLPSSSSPFVFGYKTQGAVEAFALFHDTIDTDLVGDAMTKLLESLEE
uniref:Uncharacterized protein n=1 Tax=Palpitomonas bilix TaxID=652834 RepID=A0A7S3G198_9EUKA|eukprot:CAMPEP_0113890682 /NCGR_PEP_ID=MMETSP0780_2-20120614/14290_1 /TAXON_ID=652834 /ORGANISM="Palpitomonas bilix" /LENGTH=394 /DNA_ID=CAMNT_0000880123 /DNA_START=67 /DNA_END=1251 /DNA_ORIENTATION=+ /assembly_acc=CAM_ASM_000599